jgi:cysteine desulfurase/selenocysteine lyase
METMGRQAGYLDTASIGLVPPAVSTAVATCYDALALGTRGARRWRPVVEEAEAAYAAEFGVAADEVTFLASTGEALNAVARAIPWRLGDEVMVLSDEFPTVSLPWTAVTGVEVVQVDPLPGDDRLGALLSALRPRTRVVCVSHVSSFTGTRIDLDRLGEACRRSGAFLVCDGAQAAGCVPVGGNPADFYVATGYKWLLAGFGIAVLIARNSALDRVRPGLLGHGNVPPSRSLSYGHLNLPGVYALHAAAAVRREIGVERIHRHVAESVARIAEGVTGLGFTIAGDPSYTAGIVSLAGLTDAAAAAARLAKAGVSVAARGGYLRFSPYMYTTADDVDSLLNVLAEEEPR